MAGRPKKPHRLKVIAGTSRPDRDQVEPASLPLVDGLPEPPDWLPNAHAINEWHRLTEILTSSKLLTDGSLAALGHLCSLHGRLVQNWSAGLTPTGHLMAQYRLLLNDFGLTPVAQGRLAPGTGKAGASPYADRPEKPTK